MTLLSEVMSHRTNDTKNEWYDTESNFHGENLAYSAVSSEMIEKNNRPLSDEELLSEANTFAEAMNAYRRITGRGTLRHVVSRIVAFSGKKRPKTDPTTALTYLERVANQFSQSMSEEDTRTVNELIMEQLSKIRKGTVVDPSTVTLDRVAAATDMLPENLKETGLRTFEEALYTIEFEIPGQTGEIKIPKTAAKAAHQAIELYQKMPDPTSLKAHFDTISNKTSCDEIHKIEDKLWREQVSGDATAPLLVLSK